MKICDNDFVTDIISSDINDVETQRIISDKTNAELCDVIVDLIKIIQLYAERLNVVEK